MPQEHQHCIALAMFLTADGVSIGARTQGDILEYAKKKKNQSKFLYTLYFRPFNKVFSKERVSFVHAPIIFLLTINKALFG